MYIVHRDHQKNILKSIICFKRTMLFENHNNSDNEIRD